MERRLVERAMHGDEEAFDTLIGRIGDSLHSVARRILRDTTLAQETAIHPTPRRRLSQGGPTAALRPE
jgi:DNA-directed RNA polymerase specialized sigma24 family protein